MADIATIARAKLCQRALKIIYGIEPKISIGERIIRLYYEPDILKKVQKKNEELIETKGNLQIDLFPVFLPYILKKAMVPLIGTFAGGYILGKK